MAKITYENKEQAQALGISVVPINDKTGYRLISYSLLMGFGIGMNPLELAILSNDSASGSLVDIAPPTVIEIRKYI